jgi:hypothetical protein
VTWQSLTALHGSGIGSGSSYKGNCKLTNLIIISGNITANSSSHGSGIGSGYGYYDNSTVSNLIIFDGNITANSSSHGSGIGSGCGENGNSTVANLIIFDGNITANSLSHGSGIGSGYSSKGNSTVMNLTIISGNITANSLSHGSGIGSGYRYQGDSTVTNIYLFGGNIETHSSLAAAIGHGTGAGFGHVHADFVFFTSSSCLTLRPGNQQPAVNAQSVTFLHSSIILRVQAPPIIDGRLVIISPNDLTILSQTVTSSLDGTLLGFQSHFLQIGQIILPDTSQWRLCVSSREYSHCFDLCYSGTCPTQSFAVSLPSTGRYSISALSDYMSGQLVMSMYDHYFHVASRLTFIPNARFIASDSMKRRVEI